MVEGDNAFSSWGTGLAIGVWMYCGYVAISFLGGEVENPQIIPKGMKIAIVIIMLSYIASDPGRYRIYRSMERVGNQHRLLVRAFYSCGEMGRSRLHDRGRYRSVFHIQRADSIIIQIFHTDGTGQLLS